jgi:release factor glutamine methyltransferase/ribosomal protein L3 glutamine methyltransferase
MLPTPRTTSETTVGFGPLTIAYDERIAAPRTWTTLQAQWARELLDTVPAGPVLELCCGAGHIGLLAVHGTGRPLVCVDSDPVACAYTADNARRAGRGDLVEVQEAEIEAFTATAAFPLIIADPPWVRSEQVRCYPGDPVLAIDGGADGLDVARQCVEVIDRCLHPRGAALLQLESATQASALVEEALPERLVVAGSRAEPGRGVVVKLIPCPAHASGPQEDRR